MLKVIMSVISFVSLCLLFFLLNSTTPATAGPFGILLIFMLAYMLSLGVITFFLYGMFRLFSHLSVAFVAKSPLEKLTFKKSFYFSTVIAAAPIMLIGLRSVGGVGIYDYLLVFLFVVIGCLYVSKRII